MVVLTVLNCSGTSTDDLLNARFVAPPLTISPKDISVLANSTTQFSAANGAPPYRFELFSGAGTFSNANYASAAVAGSAVISVTDSKGQRDFSRLKIVYSFSLTCPTNYIYLKANSAVNTTSDFCVAKFEMKCSADTTGLACAGTPVSQAANRPWVNISQNEAKFRCASLGPQYSLITNPQWMTIARNIEATAGNWSSNTVYSGGLNKGHDDGTPAISLAASTDGDACSGTGQTCSDTFWDPQRRTHRLATGDTIWDFGGNVAETIDWFVLNDKASPQSAWINPNSATPTTAMPAESLQSANTSLSVANGIGEYFPSVNGSGGAAWRGCNWSCINSGIYMLNLGDSATTAGTSIGYRCVFQ